ncbi:cytochrome P450 [Streptomyces sp. NPDC096323]|uniref:cytochrome P450 n=1 Tax=Streptomyces sp. NPDC096323 TaxID=3155822 RepID=UPI0033183FE0
MTLLSADLLDPQVHATRDLTEVFGWLREHDPVHWHDGAPGFWSVTRHADVMRVVRDEQRFTSLRGNMLATLLRGHDPGAGKMLVVSDGPYHKALRRLLMSGFGPRFLGPITESIARATRTQLRALVARGGGDFVSEVAAQVPLQAICELLGVPARDRGEILELTNSAMLAAPPGEAMSSQARIAQSELLLYYISLAAERRDAPGSDIVSLLVQGEVDGRRLTEEEVLLNCYNLIIGGDETARLAMAGGLLALVEHPAQWARLRSDPGLVDSAVEEVLRWTTPARHVGRTVLSDTGLGGRTLRAGDVVVLWNIAANRDPAVFSEPEVFDLARTPNRHLTFGYGPHFCIGAQLARAEIRTMLTELRTTVSAIGLTSEATRIPSTFITGLETLPVAFVPAEGQGS